MERTGAELGVLGVGVEVEPRDESFFSEETLLASESLRDIELLGVRGVASLVEGNGWWW